MRTFGAEVIRSHARICAIEKKNNTGTTSDYVSKESIWLKVAQSARHIVRISVRYSNETYSLFPSIFQLSTWFKNSTRMNWLASPRYAVMTKIESFLLPLRWNLFIYSCVAIFGCDERICPIGMSQRYPLNVTCRLGATDLKFTRERRILKVLKV